MYAMVHCFYTHKVVHDAEGHLEAMRLAAESARKKLSDTKLQWRLKRKEFENGLHNTVPVYIYMFV